MIDIKEQTNKEQIKTELEKMGYSSGNYRKNLLKKELFRFSFPLNHPLVDEKSGLYPTLCPDIVVVAEAGVQIKIWAPGINKHGMDYLYKFLISLVSQYGGNSKDVEWDNNLLVKKIATIHASNLKSKTIPTVCREIEKKIFSFGKNIIKKPRGTLRI